MTHRTAIPRLLLLTALFSISACAKPTAFPTVPADKPYFAILGDVRLPHPLAIWKNDNQRERVTLINVVAQRKPAFVAMHGDFVFKGGSARQWRAFDRTFAPLRWEKVPILPGLGNHEYYGGAEAGLRHYFARFPELKPKRWYRRDVRGLAVIMLDSNPKYVGQRMWRQQVAWFADELQKIDADPKIRGAVVFLHHPVYTNSSKHRDHKPSNRDFRPLFERSRKAMVMISGHVHTYERFARGRKMYLNSGGGGAPRRPLLTGDARRHKDDLYRGPKLRPFHYVWVELTDRGLRWTAHGLQRGDKKLHVMDRFETPWPGSAPAAPPPKRKAR